MFYVTLALTIIIVGEEIMDYIDEKEKAKKRR